MNSCYGPHPVRASIAYLEEVNKNPYYQYELFSMGVEKIFSPKDDGFIEYTSFLAYPYEYALNYIDRYNAKNSL